MIELAGVSLSYGAKTVLRDCEFCAADGERIVIAGRSGSGKTSILRLIAGLVAPDSGSVILGGQTASRDGAILIEPEHRNLGYVFQDLALWPHMSVFENVEFPLRARGVARLDRIERVRSMLSLAEIEALGQRRPSSLSGGEQQRVAIARALIGKPKSVLMDEPLASLDNDLREELVRRICGIQTQLGFTLIYVTHNQAEVQALEARVIHLLAPHPPS